MIEQSLDTIEMGKKLGGAGDFLLCGQHGAAFSSTGVCRGQSQRVWVEACVVGACEKGDKKEKTRLARLKCNSMVRGN